MAGFLAKFTLMGALTASVTGEESLVTDSEGRRTAATCTTSDVRVWTIRTARKAGEPPPHLAAAADWIRSHSLKVSDLNNPPTLRIAYDATASGSASPTAA